MSALTPDDYQALRSISKGQVDLDNAAPEVLERVEYLVTFGLAYYDEDNVYLTRTGHRMLSDPSHQSARVKVSYSDYQQSQQRKQPEPATPYQTREQLVGEAVSRVFGSIFRLVIVYLLGIFTPYEIRLRIFAFLGAMLTPIVEFIESLR